MHFIMEFGRTTFDQLDNLKLIFRKPRTSWYLSVLRYYKGTKIDVLGFLVKPRTSGVFPSYDEKTKVRCTRLFWLIRWAGRLAAVTFRV